MTAAYSVGGPLAGCVALVTGAGGGVGSAAARALNELGAALCLAGRRREPLEAVAAKLSGDAAVCPLDLTTDTGISTLVDTLRLRFQNRLDVLVHCAGIHHRAAMEAAAIEDLDRQFATNVRAPYRLTRAMLPTLKACRGQVVFVNSTQGLNAGPAVGQYAATQHALRAIADSLRQEVNGSGVRVLTLHLGRTASALQEGIFRAEGRPYQPDLLLQPDDIAAVLACCVTLPATAEVTTLSIRPMIKSY